MRGKCRQRQGKQGERRSSRSSILTFLGSSPEPTRSSPSMASSGPSLCGAVSPVNLIQGDPVNFAFRLRHLFGPGSRSEVMRTLLTYRDGPLDAARIADEAAFAKRNASEALAAVAASGAISATWSGNERHFRARREPRATLLDLGEMPVFVSWVHLLPAALKISTWLDEKAGTDESEYLLASHARALMERIGRDLQIAGVDLPRRFPPTVRHTCLRSRP